MGQTCTTTVVRFDGKIYVTGNISLFRRWFFVVVIALLLFVIVCELAAIYDRQNGGK
nr:MAG TPA: hypothetical protein [Caudoviricetes sp.]